MANSKYTPVSVDRFALYEYVKSFEQTDILLPATWIVVRIDGRGFHKLSRKYRFEKPTDRRALELMNAAAIEVMKELPDLNVAYGVSDEYSKLVSTIVSTFTACYIYKWQSFFPSTPLEPSHLPTFDGRAVLYPSIKNLRDYLSWRQVDCHINNLYNTTYWMMVQRGGMSPTDAEKELQGTVSSDKNEILFKRFGINYNNEPEMYKKGSVVYRQFQFESPANDRADSPQGKQGEDMGYDLESETSRTQREKQRKLRRKANVVVEHVDIIKDDFWKGRPWILSDKPGKLPMGNS
ncbi:hypothetical protein Egran_04891 [Elaphomyces granulatus]|uniref:tRNA(His) guanylyltransferase n=1 Tax=Elaphomyces granulatus TaxID=519963 RepID=A0A232LT93_9EURO|nr:hypothetical protein Egran_04891 [Elaphomyces granulatus]